MLGLTIIKRQIGNMMGQHNIFQQVSCVVRAACIWNCIECEMNVNEIIARTQEGGPGILEELVMVLLSFSLNPC
jgi:hypothetical protein